jgi:hypothetical protein
MVRMEQKREREQAPSTALLLPNNTVDALGLTPDFANFFRLKVSVLTQNSFSKAFTLASKASTEKWRATC